MSRDTASSIVGDLVARAPAAIEEAASETANVAGEVIGTVESQLEAFGRMN
jgi:hypothetical protein